ncbi:retrotransposon protein, putative, ty1-copia subclass [Tanacetum coccineum]
MASIPKKLTLDDHQLNLPDEVLMEILLQLPLLSLQLFKSVSKHWFSLITSEYFTRRLQKPRIDTPCEKIKNIPFTWNPDITNMILAFDPTKSPYYKVMLTERIDWNWGEDRQQYREEDWEDDPEEDSEQWRNQKVRGRGAKKIFFTKDVVHTKMKTKMQGFYIVCLQYGGQFVLEYGSHDYLVGNNSTRNTNLEILFLLHPVAQPGEQILLRTLRSLLQGLKAKRSACCVLMFGTGTSDDCERIENFTLAKQEVRFNRLAPKFLKFQFARMGKDVNELHAMLSCMKNRCQRKIWTWRRNCPCNHPVDEKEEAYLRELALQGFTGESRKLTPGALISPSGLVIVLNNCHYAPSITRGVISVSRLFDDGFINRFDDNNVISVSKDNLVYFMAVPRDGIFEIDMSCSNTNDSSMYAITNKRAKINLDSSLLWHCRLGHISKKRIEKLQHDGLLNSIDIESLGKCVSCLSGKMARKPYSHQVERAKDLLGLIHTDVFQREVENQLGKTIKSLRSDRGGEYMSQEFLDHLKEHGIIAHRTPPYTPQNNGVSERRNRTLLDMVRSMMSQTTLPKSF